MQIDNLRARAESLDTERPSTKVGERQSRIVDALPIVFYTAAPKGRFSGPRFLSESIAGAIGFKADAFVEDPDLWAARIHPDDRARLKDHLGRMYDTGSLSVEYRWRCADGSERVFLDQGILARDSSGAPSEVVGTCLDITDRYELGLQMALSEKERAVESLPRAFTHDFNNIMSAIIWNLELLGRSSQGAGGENELIESAMGSALNGLELLRQFSADRKTSIPATTTKEEPSYQSDLVLTAIEDIVVLVVEDETPLRLAGIAQIRQLGYQVLEAANAAAALGILRTNQRVDLLFTDVVMIGGMDGFTLARRAVDLKPLLKVVITSGYMPAIDHITNLSERFLPKPYNREELRSALASALFKDAS